MLRNKLTITKPHRGGDYDGDGDGDTVGCVRGDYCIVHGGKTQTAAVRWWLATKTGEG